jgi:hypothetical protein
MKQQMITAASKAVSDARGKLREVFDEVPLGRLSVADVREFETLAKNLARARAMVVAMIGEKRVEAAEKAVREELNV